MSIRVVPVSLRVGKKYVLRSGEVVTIQECQHWQIRRKWPFVAVISGEDTYFKDNGHSSRLSGDDIHIVRPAYEAGEYYINGDNELCLIDNIDDEPVYCVNTIIKNGCHTEDGRYVYGDDNLRDLMDYAPENRVAQHIKSLEKGRTTTENYVGRRVRSDDGFFGTIMSFDLEDRFLIKYDDTCAGAYYGRWPGIVRQDVVPECAHNYLHQWVSKALILDMLWSGTEPVAKSTVDESPLVDMPPLPSPYIQEEEPASVADDAVLAYLDTAIEEGLALNDEDRAAIWKAWTDMKEGGIARGVEYFADARRRLKLIR